MRIIAHLDMDAFFAAVEERDNPRFKGKPIVVGADPVGGKGRGVVSTANYVARKYGIHSAMPISTAWRLAEAARKRGETAAIFTGGHFEKYGKVSAEIMDIIRGYTPLVEESSIDEAYFDLSSAESWEQAKEIAQKIKTEIKDKERLTASVGIGTNKLIAKIASDMQKPDGLTLVTEEQAESFLEPLSVRKIPGIGPKTELLLAKQGVKTIKDLKKWKREEFEDFGGWGNELYNRIRGKDESPIVLEYETKSVGEQETFPEDVADAAKITETMRVLSDSVWRSFGKLKDDKKDFRTVVITVRFADFETKTKSHTLKNIPKSADEFYFEAIKLLLPFFDKRENPKHKKFRLIGVRIVKH
jgi:DNA polymerase IV (DinB-like DNA polymerase)